jgi:hypothetical protein
LKTRRNITHSLEDSLRVIVPKVNTSSSNGYLRYL